MEIFCRDIEEPGKSTQGEAQRKAEKHLTIQTRRCNREYLQAADPQKCGRYGQFEAGIQRHVGTVVRIQTEIQQVARAPRVHVLPHIRLPVELPALVQTSSGRTVRELQHPPVRRRVTKFTGSVLQRNQLENVCAPFARSQGLADRLGADV